MSESPALHADPWPRALKRSNAPVPEARSISEASISVIPRMSASSSPASSFF